MSYLPPVPPNQIPDTFIPHPNAGEVAAVFKAPLSMFVDPAPGSHSSEVRISAYSEQGRIHEISSSNHSTITNKTSKSETITMLTHNIILHDCVFPGHPVAGEAVETCFGECNERGVRVRIQSCGEGRLCSGGLNIGGSAYSICARVPPPLFFRVSGQKMLSLDGPSEAFTALPH